MADRRPLIEGINGGEVPRAVEDRFVFGGPAKPAAAAAEPSPTRAGPPVGRSPLTTRVRTDYAQALKRASLERQLAGVEPHTVQDILEEALGPWLATHGYLG